MSAQDRETQDSGSSGRPRVLVVGTGAVGGFYGGKLAQAGARVSTLCRSDYETVRDKGIAVKSIWGDFLFRPERVIRDVSAYGPPPDFVLVALKVLPKIDTPGLIRTVVGPNTAIFLLQNGIEIEHPIAEAFPGNEIISGLAFVCLSRAEPGRVDHLDYGRLVLGRFPAGPSTKVDEVARLFNAAQVPCTVTEDVLKARWRKLVWNAAFNPISVLSGGADTKTMVETPESVDLARKVMAEVFEIAAAAGHSLPDGVVEKNIAGTRTMAPFKTSMLQDFEEGRPLEVEAIIGRAVQIARSNGVPAPHLESLYALMKLVERKQRAA
jgi:2-dehydropantoate 2-reductase